MALDFDAQSGSRLASPPNSKSDARRPSPNLSYQRKLHTALVLAAQPEAMDM